MEELMEREQFLDALALLESLDLLESLESLDLLESLESLDLLEIRKISMTDWLTDKNINHSLTHWLTDNLKSRDASASKKTNKRKTYQD